MVKTFADLQGVNEAKTELVEDEGYRGIAEEKAKQVSSYKEQGRGIEEVSMVWAMSSHGLNRRRRNSTGKLAARNELHGEDESEYYLTHTAQDIQKDAEKSAEETHGKKGFLNKTQYERHVKEYYQYHMDRIANIKRRNSNEIHRRANEQLEKEIVSGRNEGLINENGIINVGEAQRIKNNAIDTEIKSMGLKGALSMTRKQAIEMNSSKYNEYNSAMASAVAKTIEGGRLIQPWMSKWLKNPDNRRSMEIRMKKLTIEPTYSEEQMNNISNFSSTSPINNDILRGLTQKDINTYDGNQKQGVIQLEKATSNLMSSDSRHTISYVNSKGKRTNMNASLQDVSKEIINNSIVGQNMRVISPKATARITGRIDKILVNKEIMRDLTRKAFNEELSNTSGKKTTVDLEKVPQRVLTKVTEMAFAEEMGIPYQNVKFDFDSNKKIKSPKQSNEIIKVRTEATKTNQSKTKEQPKKIK